MMYISLTMDERSELKRNLDFKYTWNVTDLLRDEHTAMRDGTFSGEDR